MKEKVLVIIPTYNEVENIRSIIENIFGRYPWIHLLVVDDDSNDGTPQEVEQLQGASERLFLIRRRETAKGLGKSYIEGMQWALQQGMEKVIQMDADFSHDPTAIRELLEKSNGADLVVGSRYIHGTRVVNWPASRLILSKTANRYIRLITRLPVIDCTSGFKCWNVSVLREIGLNSIRSEGFAFLMEMTYRAHHSGFSIAEVPIVFREREKGVSKMWRSGIWESALTPWRLIWRNQKEK